MEPEIPKCDLPVRKKPERKAKASAPRKGKNKPAPAAPEVWDPKAEAAAARAAVASKARKGPMIEAPDGAVIVPGISKRKRIPPPPEIKVEAKPEKPAAKAARLRAEAKAIEPDPVKKAASILLAAREADGRAVTDEIFLDMLTLVAMGMTLRQVFRQPGMPSRMSFYRYVECEDQAEAARRMGRLARARAMGMDEIAEEILDIVDDGSNDWIEREQDGDGPAVELDREHISRSKLRAETRLKLLAVWDPKRYGATVKHADADGGKLADRSLSASDLAIGLAKLVEAAKRNDLALPASEVVIDQDPAA